MEKKLATLRMLYLFIGMLMVAIACAILFPFLNIVVDESIYDTTKHIMGVPLFVWLVTAVFFSVAGLSFYEMHLLAVAQKRSIVIGCIVAGLICLIFPFGTALGVFLLCVLLSRKTRVLLT